MQDNKNLVEEALIQMRNVEQAIAENAKGILRSTMKEEISQLVKESLTEQDEEEMGFDLDTEVDMDDEDMNMDDEDMNMDDEDMDMDVDNVEMDFDSVDTDEPIDLTDASDEEILRVFKSMGEDDGIIVKKDGEDIHLSDTDADVEYLLKLGESTEEEMDEEYEEEMDEEYEEEMDEEYEEEMDEEYEEEMDEEDESIDDIIDAIFSDKGSSEIDLDSEDEEVMYEIEMDEEYEEEEDEEEFELGESYSPKKSTIKPKGVGMGSAKKFSYKKQTGGFDEKKPEAFKGKVKAVGTGSAKKSVFPKGENTDGKPKVVKKETKEASRTYGMGSKEGRGLRKGITPNRNMTFESLDSEVNVLRSKNEEYRKALNVFREKLNEVAVFNSNLAYATRLFTEHSTTKKEKINILRRFDNVDSLKESKNLYRAIKDELSNPNAQSINENVEKKLIKTVSTGSSASLIESKTYENPQFMRMKDLMSKIA